jgi:Erv1 / Alr family
MWKTMHHIALSYPTPPTQRERQAYQAYFENLHEVIPCKVCAANYRDHLKELPVSDFMTDAFTLFSWTVKVHNIVNRINVKQEWDIMSMYELYTRPPKTNKKKSFQYTLLILLAIVVVAVIFIYNACMIYAKHNILLI